MARPGIAGVLAAAVVLLVAGCGSDDPLGHPWRPGGPDTGPAAPVLDADLSGRLAGAGSSAQESAMQAWVAGFQAAVPGVSVAYDPVGSGGGRTQFIEGGIQFGGTDAPLDDEELAAAEERCAPGAVVEVPLYVSPIAVVFNLDGVDALNMSAATVAAVFNREIVSWDDPRIAAENPGVDLPTLRITPVNRSDESGTTKNFTEYLYEAAPEAWPHEPSGEWPLAGGQSAQGNSGVIQTVTDGVGTVTYADASKAGSLGTARLGVGDGWVPFSPDAAAAVLDSSPLAAGRPATSLVFDLDRTTTEPGVYPLVLVSYTVACTSYPDPDDAAMVASFLTYVASELGQAVSADTAGSAPISADLRSQVMSVVEEIG